MMTALAWIAGPTGRLVAIALAALVVLGGAYRKGYTDRDARARIEQAEAREKWNREANEAISNARRARDDALRGGMPNDDPDLRD